MSPSHRHPHCHDHDASHEHNHGSHDRRRHSHDGEARAHHGCCAAPSPSTQDDCRAGSPPPPRASSRLPRPRTGETLSRLRIAQMDCPTEETLIRGKLDKMADVRGLDFNLMQRVLSVVHADDALPRILAAIGELGMTPLPLADEQDAGGEPAPARRAYPWLLGLSGVLAALSEAAHFLSWPEWLSMGAALAAIVLCGGGTYRKGWIAVRHGNLNINALMSIAVTGAVLIGQWPEAAMVMVLFNLAELIEARSLDRARRAVRNVLDRAPKTAAVRQADGSWRDAPVSGLAIGDVVRARPGESIAADGVVTLGASAVNQAPITGESLPVDKAEGDTLYAGTLNTWGELQYRVTADAGNTTLARIIHAVENAQGARAPTQRFIDRFSRVYTPIVVGIAALLAVVPPLLSLMSWSDAVYRALALLIIACPCALVISTPVTIVSGLTAASRRGILVKGGVFLENGRKLRWLALDKTGTLTHGEPVCTDVRVFGGGASDTGASLLRMASLAARSDHPVSLAVADTERLSRLLAQARADEEADAPTRRDPATGGLDAAAGGPAAPAHLAIDDFSAIAGRGVSGRIGGIAHHLGSPRLMQELGVPLADAADAIAGWESQGKTVVALTDGQALLAAAAVADTVRDSSRAAIADLHGLGVRTLMLSGDNPQAARAVADSVGVDEAHGGLMPQDKLALIESRLGRGGEVGMVGDGINDAPALARADIGFAMGAAGTDTAIDTADVALMDDDLRKIGVFVRLSRATHRILTQNIALALGIKALFLALAVSGHASLWMAVFADVGASLLVVANGLRLLRRSDAKHDSSQSFLPQLT